MPENIREIIKTLLKNKLITIPEVAMLQANKKENRDELIAVIQRIYETREISFGDVAAIVVSEDDILALIDYITSEPISISPNEYPDNGIKVVPAPYIPNNPWVIPNSPNTDPYPYPYRPDIIYCQQTAQNKIHV